MSQRSVTSDNLPLFIAKLMWLPQRSDANKLQLAGPQIGRHPGHSMRTGCDDTAAAIGIIDCPA